MQSLLSCILPVNSRSHCWQTRSIASDDGAARFVPCWAGSADPGVVDEGSSIALTSSLLASFRLQTSKRVLMRIALVAELMASSSDTGSGVGSSSSSLSIRIGVSPGRDAMLFASLRQRRGGILLYGKEVLRLYIYSSVGVEVGGLWR
jgi:hypothetical protein